MIASRTPLGVLLTVVWGLGLGFAAHAAPADAPRPAAAASSTGEPAVQRTVITEDGTVIEELRVRGELQSITVHPKKGSGLPDYEIVPNARGRDPHTNGSGSRGAGGQRVWSILKF